MKRNIRFSAVEVLDSSDDEVEEPQRKKKQAYQGKGKRISTKGEKGGVKQHERADCH